MEQGNLPSSIMTFGVDHTVISRTSTAYHHYGTPVKSRGGGRQRATTVALDRVRIIQARQGNPASKMTCVMLLVSMFRRRQSVNTVCINYPSPEGEF